ncbi:protein lethal(2)essential for life [Caerostris extrusa]|uniref:Protein lethal(2)essential for life n=1 Tax=Caerostris extrusa TaxID=172846 RepID=A0AAV4QX21_CAEEX|nr:protein lethal(2)essential for life [Caerostris extrusa]
MFPRIGRHLHKPTDCPCHNIVRVFPASSTAQTPRFVFRQPPQVPVDPRISDAKKDDSNSNKHHVIINVKPFRPDDIDIKIVDNFLVVSGKHDVQVDGNGLVAREFTRRCRLPDEVGPVTDLICESKWCADPPNHPKKNERIVPITIEQPAAVMVTQQQQAAEQNSNEPKQ